MNLSGTAQPDYTGGSIVNLMRSIADACGAPGLGYAPATRLDGAELDAATTLVLLVVDGMGLDFLERRARGGAFHSHLRGALTSVFPTTTACAIPAFLTGLAPQQHGLTGWHMYFDEINRVVAVLPLTPRGGGAFGFAPGELPRRLFSHSPLSARMQREAYVLSPARISESAFNRFHTVGATRWPYRTRDELFARLADIVSAPGRKYVYAYFPTIDTLAHDHGIDSPQVAGVFKDLDSAFARFLERIRGSETVVLTTADHGFIDSPPERLIELDDHPRLAAMLVHPLCGEWRVAYAYVKPDCHAAFADYVATELGHAATLFRSEELVEQGWFGNGAEHPHLRTRIGDFTLVMKDNWTIKDWLAQEKRHMQVGTHGGTSTAETFVPLIVAHA
jgi:hypothetical protein